MSMLAVGSRRAVLCMLLAWAGAASAWPGTVSHVTDGDTVWVRPHAARPVAVRLVGIDAPERCQAGGPEARDALAGRLLRRQVEVETVGRDDYGRTLGRLQLGGEDVGAWLVRRGHAWSTARGRQRGPYATEERSARRHRRGVFGAASPAVEPRVFRRQHGACPRPPRGARGR